MRYSPTSETIYALLFLLPALAIMSLFLFFPIINAVWISFHRAIFRISWLGLPFIGLKNYILGVQETYFIHVLGYTLYFTVVSVALELLIGLGMALLAFQAYRLRGFIRASIVLPWAIPPLIQAMMWRWIYQRDVGVLGDILVKLHIVSSPPDFLGDPILAMHSVIFADVWKCSSFMAIILLAGLASIPRDIYDAAAIDGARGFTRFRYITLPLIRPMMLVALLFRTIDAFRVFDLVYGLTGGGPGVTTEVMSTFAYEYYFEYANFGRGAAYSVIILLMVLLLSLFYIREMRKRLTLR